MIPGEKVYLIKNTNFIIGSYPLRKDLSGIYIFVGEIMKPVASTDQFGKIYIENYELINYNHLRFLRNHKNKNYEGLTEMDLQDYLDMMR